MSKAFFARALLISVLIVPLAAEADTIDDFVLTGDGHTISFSLPSAISSPDYSLFISFYASAPTTIDGISGYTTTGQYLLPNGGGDIYLLSVPSSIFGESELYFGGPPGPPFIDWSAIPASNPPPYQQDNVVATFIPGTYTLESLADFGNNVFEPPVYYTLMITPEDTATTTPEPSSLILLVTGASGMIGFAVFKRRRVEL
ncbi:MAG: PEP-CTERM sorting domain-containing protein [Edaphobacter sp.]